MNKPENQVCSDCPERQPRWASLIVPPPGSPPGTLPMGAFCCLECSGSHRRLGVHISFVRSINLDSWKEKEVIAMENGGNHKVNAIFEARLGSTAKPTTAADGPTRERFIRDKYERRKFYDPHVLENYAAPKGQEEDAAPASRRTKVTRHPSEAARLRAEAKLGVPKAPQPTNAPPPAPPAPSAQEVDLLDFADFDSPAPAPAAAPTPAVAHTTMPELDLFANMTVNPTPVATTFNRTSSAAAPLVQQQPARTTNEQIMAMFNTSLQQQPTVTVAAMSATPNGGMMMAMPAPQQRTNPVMNNMMNMQTPPLNMMMQGSSSNTQGGVFGYSNMTTTPQQQQQQQQGGGGTMFMQQQGNAMFMQQQGNSTLMMQKNNQGNVMLMQQGNVVSPQNNMVHTPTSMQMMQLAHNSDGFGFPQEAMGSGPPIATSTNQFYNAYTGTTTTTQNSSSSSSGFQMMPKDDYNNNNTYMSKNGRKSPQQQPQDPFSQFGTNVFR